jgi:PAS domain S-box-containing protein
MEKLLRILFVEDSEDDALLILFRIKKAGYEVEQSRVETAIEMEKMLIEKEWDIVLSDYKMPHFNGLEALAILKKSGIDIPFIIISGTIGEEIAVEAMRSGAHDYIMKNNLQRLLPAIERELRESENRAERKLLEKKKRSTDEALRESENRYRHITEGLTDFLYSVRIENDCAGKLVPSPACLSVTGYSINEFDEDPHLWQKMVSKNDQVKIEQHIQQVLSGFDVPPIEYRIIRKDGMVRWVLDTTILFKDETGRLLSYDVVIKDITERKLAEEQILKLNRIYAVLSNINQAIVRTQDSNALLNDACRIAIEYGNFQMAWVGIVNNKTNRVDAVASDGIIGDYLDKINIDLSDAIQSKGPTGTAINTRKHVVCNDVRKDEIMAPWRELAIKYNYKSVASFPLIVFDKTIGVFLIYSNETNFFDEEEIRLLDEMAMDISFGLEYIETETKRKQAEIAFRESELKFQAIFNQTFQLIGLLTIDGVILEANKTALDYSGLKESDVKGKPLWETHWWTHDPKLQAQLREGIQEASKGKFIRFEATHLDKEGNLKNIDFSLKPIFNEANKVIFLIEEGRDITDRKRAEEELKKHRDSLEELVNNRTAELLIAKEKAEDATKAKSAFLANMSHELRTPLNSILGFSEILSNITDNHEQKEYLSSIQSSGRSLLDLINNVLDFSKIEAGKIQVILTPVNLKEMLFEVSNFFKPHCMEKGIKIIPENAADMPDFLILDKLKLRQILLNLISNAVKCTDKGYIKISTSVIWKGSDVADLNIAVQDTGIGIPLESHSKIFEVFEQGNHIYGGTGLGLSITKQLVEILDGSIFLESEVKKGSTFTVKFRDVKISNEFQDDNKSKYVDPNSIKFQKASILIVDDNNDNRKVIKGLLQEYGFDLFQAVNGKDAMKIIAANTIDIVFMDIQMPVMDGYKAMQKIKQDPKYSKIPIIAVTAFGYSEDEQKAIQSGFDAYIRKPVTLFSILGSLFKFLNFEITDTIETINTNVEYEKEKIPDLIKLTANIKSEIIPLWNELQILRPKKKVIDFAGQIIELGEKYKSKVLLNFGNDLLSTTRTYNVSKQIKMIESFPKLLDALK